MRAGIRAILAAALLGGLFFPGRAEAQDSHVEIPAALSGISDGLLRDSLALYAPDYDSLPRAAQLTAYANIYRVLYHRELSVPRVQPGASSGVVRIPVRPYDPRVDALVRPPFEDPNRYTRYWDAERDGGTGVYQPWRDPMWTPWEEKGGILGHW